MKRLSLRILSIIAVASAAISLALRIISLFFFYDKIGYYQTGAPLPIIANILFGASIAFFLIAAIFSVSKEEKITAPNKIAQYASLLPMGAIIFHVIRILMGSFNDTAVNKYVMLLSGVAAAVFFFLLYFAKQPNLATIYCGLGALIYVFFNWVFAYFDFFIPLNSTDKIFFYIACAGAILFIFNEICACYGTVRSRFYYFSLFSAIITLCVGSVASLVGFACGLFKSYITLEADIFLLSLLIYATVRLITLLRAPVSKQEVPITTEKAQENDENESE